MAKRKRKWKGTPAQRAALKKGQAALARWREAHGKRKRNPERKNPRKTVESLFQYLAKIKGWKPGSYELETWSPGDGKTRYRVNKLDASGGTSKGPFGSSYWLGAAEAETALRAAIDVIENNPRGKGKRTRKFKRCVRKVRARGGVRSPKKVCAKAIFHKKKRKSNPKDFMIKAANGFWTGRNSITDNPRDAVHYPRRAAAQKTMLALRHAYPSVTWAVVP